MSHVGIGISTLHLHAQVDMYLVWLNISQGNNSVEVLDFSLAMC